MNRATIKEWLHYQFNNSAFIRSFIIFLYAASYLMSPTHKFEGFHSAQKKLGGLNGNRKEDKECVF